MACKRPDDVPLNLSPNKRVCTSPLAQVEGRPTGSDGSQVSHSKVAGSVGLGARIGTAISPSAPTASPEAGAPALPAVPQQEQQPQGPAHPALGLRLRAGLGGRYILGGKAEQGPQGTNKTSFQGGGVRMPPGVGLPGPWGNLKRQSLKNIKAKRRELQGITLQKMFLLG